MSRSSEKASRMVKGREHSGDPRAVSSCIALNSKYKSTFLIFSNSISSALSLACLRVKLLCGHQD